MWWGEGKQDGSFFPMCDHRGDPYWLFALWTSGPVEIQFERMLNRPPFGDEGARLRVLERLNAIEDVALPPSRIDKRPSFPVAALAEEARLAQFLAVMDDMVAAIRST